ncbi:MAG TPA: roadblock/LC7 domain-containing protein [Gaiellaceae bacterium]|nr:roadblock/LC7 domain-containing protein [Gaiellaceae bacterium]
MASTTQALADLTEISTQVEAAVVFDREGTVLGSTVDGERAGRLASTALELVRAAEESRPEGAEALVQLDVALGDGSVFVAADGDRLIAATTAPDPTVGLVFYDLKSCLRGLSEEAEAKPKPRRRTTTTKKKDDETQ